MTGMGSWQQMRFLRQILHCPAKPAFPTASTASREASYETAASNILTVSMPSSALNRDQQQAVESVFPVTAVIAGPGTGKTKTLVSRIEHLMGERGVKPSEITAVTFTNKAADELTQRIRQALPGQAQPEPDAGRNLPFPLLPAVSPVRNRAVPGRPRTGGRMCRRNHRSPGTPLHRQAVSHRPSLCIRQGCPPRRALPPIWRMIPLLKPALP